MSTRECYTGANVCENQSNFNTAVETAIKKVNKDSQKQSMPWIYVYMSFWTIFFVWAVLLAISQPAGPTRIVHLVFAIAFAPIYVLANAFNLLQ